MESDILFYEKQKFRQWWLWLILLVVFVVVGMIALQLMTEENVKKNITSLLILGASVLLVLIPVVLLLLKMKLETRVQADGIYIKFFPFQLRWQHYPWQQVSKAFIRRYNALGEYGGWGIRISTAGNAYNVSGNTGLQLVFANKKRLLVGTNQPEALSAVLEQLGQLTKRSE